MCDQGRSKKKKRMKRSELEFSATPTFQSHFCIFCSLFESKGQQGWYTGHCVLPGRSCHHFCRDIFPVALLLLTSSTAGREKPRRPISIYTDCCRFKTKLIKLSTCHFSLYQGEAGHGRCSFYTCQHILSSFYPHIFHGALLRCTC